MTGKTRTALVTGAAGGLGQAILHDLQARGIVTVAADLHYPEKMEKGAGGVTVGLDVTEPESIATAFAQIGDVDILVNNAGIFPHADFLDATDEQWRATFEVNVFGAVSCCRAALPKMTENGWGRIIMIGSNTVQMGWVGLSHYIASKSALTGLVRGLAHEVGDKGVTANVVAPTLTRTPGTRELFEQAPEVVDAIVSRQAIRREGRPDDVARVVGFLSSGDSDFVTGQTIMADGGLAKL